MLTHEPTEQQEFVNFTQSAEGHIDPEISQPFFSSKTNQFKDLYEASYKC